MSRQEELEGIVRESGSLPDRLAESRARIGKMCSEHRPPKMTIPVQWNDDDFFISTTINDAMREIHELTNAIERIFSEPYGCSLCDSGVMRNPAKGHQPDCPFEIARLALERVKGVSSL